MEDLITVCQQFTILILYNCCSLLDGLSERFESIVGLFVIAIKHILLNVFALLHPFLSNCLHFSLHIHIHFLILGIDVST